MLRRPNYKTCVLAFKRYSSLGGITDNPEAPVKVAERRSADVVVAGGGYAGVYLTSNLLEAGIDCLMVDPKPYFYHNVGAVRAIVKPGFVEKLYMPYKYRFGNNFVEAKIVDMGFKENQLVLDNNVGLFYKVLVIATGCRHTPPFKYNPDSYTIYANKAVCEETTERIEKARSIAIVGGGAVGCEVAAEIKDLYKDKSVTLFHATDNLVYLETPPKFRELVTEKLERMGVTLELGQRVSAFEQQERGPYKVSTDEGHEYKFDYVIKSSGYSKANTDFAKQHLGQSMDERGFLRVNSFLQVEGQQNIFAFGDCSNADVKKQVVSVMAQLPVVTKNVKSQLSNVDELQAYTPAHGPYYTIGLSLGSRDGALCVGSKGWVLPSIFPILMKSRDMMVWYYKRFVLRVRSESAPRQESKAAQEV